MLLAFSPPCSDSFAGCSALLAKLSSLYRDVGAFTARLPQVCLDHSQARMAFEWRSSDALVVLMDSTQSIDIGQYLEY
jgi:hypothetical protein